VDVRLLGLAIGTPETTDSSDDLRLVARDMFDLADNMDDAEYTSLLVHFLDTARRLTDARTTLEDRDWTARPAARLFTALGWLQIRRQAVRDGKQAADAALRLLGDFYSTTGFRSLANRLCTVVQERPDRNLEVLVYDDLLDMLPRHLRVSRSKEVIPDLLVLAIVGADASARLSSLAERIEQEIDRARVVTDSGVLGVTAHVLADAAIEASKADETIIDRSDGVRTRILELAGASL
jgi:hypothetical protein